jgi:hypothetical protein
MITWQVTYALGALYYLCNPSTKKDVLKPDVIRIIREYAVAGSVNISFSNLANAFLEKHVDSWPCWVFYSVRLTLSYGFSISSCSHYELSKLKARTHPVSLLWTYEGMYRPESMERSSKHKRHVKSLCSTMKNLLNQPRNKYNQDTICMKSCE